MTHMLEQTIERLRGLESLPEDQQRLVAKQVLEVLDKITGGKETPIRKRIAGLGEGTITIPDDFDEPLPDAFWLGEE